MSKPDGGPASDMTVRTWLAGQALAGVSVDDLIVKKHQSQQEVLAQVVVEIADATLAELERTGEATS